MPFSPKWVYKAKPINDGTSAIRTHFKARLAACGFEQWHGIDYNEKLAPVTHWSTLRTIIALATFLGWPISHMHVVTGFLNVFSKRKFIYFNRKVL